MGIEENLGRIADSLERIASAQEENVKINAAYKKFLVERDARRIMADGGVQDDPVSAYVSDMGAPADPQPQVENVLADAQVEAPAPASVAEAPSGPIITQEMVLAAAHVSAAPTALTALGKDLTFDVLKMELLARGHAYKKGTKTTTLQKEWDKYKHEPIIGAKPTPITLAEPQNDVNPAGYAPSLTEAPAKVESAPAPAPAAAPDDLFTIPQGAPSVRVFNKAEAIAEIQKTFGKPDETHDEAQALERDREIVLNALKTVGYQSFGQLSADDTDKATAIVLAYESLKGITHA